MDDQFHKDHQKIMVNNDDNQVFQFLPNVIKDNFRIESLIWIFSKIPSKRFYCLLYRVQEQWENHHVHKIYEKQLVYYYEYVLLRQEVEHWPVMIVLEEYQI